MSKILLIAEKPSVAKNLRDTLEPGAKAVTMSKGKPPVYVFEGDKYIFAYSVGHIIEIKNVKEITKDYKWRMDLLPYDLGNPIPTKVSTRTRPIFTALKKTLERKDIAEIVIATDPDREGENIWRKIHNHMPKSVDSIKMTRMWINEWTPSGLKKAFKNRYDSVETKGLSDSAQAREESDYLFGVNLTVAATVQLAQYPNMLNLGRVQTPTLNIIVDRENEILNFKPEAYSVINIVTESDESGKPLTLRHKLPQGTRLSPADAVSLKAKLDKTKDAKLSVVERKRKQSPPRLFNLSSLSKEMNRRYGYSLKHTLSIAQSLYEKGLTTYPRTDEVFISESAAKMAYDALANCHYHTAEVNKVTSSGWKMNPRSITKKTGLTHEAITPVYGSVAKSLTSGLNQGEENVYKAVSERFVANFFPDAELLVTTVSTDIEEETFDVKGEVVEKEGWMEVISFGRDNLLPKVTNDKNYPIIDVKEEEKQTQPPARFNEASILDAMMNAGRYVEDTEDKEILKETEGLGTVATRPDIVEKLIKDQYVTMDGKSLRPTEKAMSLMQLLPKDIAITSPVMTAKLETDLKKIEEGKMSLADFQKQVNKAVADSVDAMRSLKGAVSRPTETYGACPLCADGELYGNSKAVSCSNWNNKTKPCKFTLWKKIASKNLSQTELTQLIQDGQTKGKVSGLKSRKGKFFSAKVLFDKDTGKTEFDFS